MTAITPFTFTGSHTVRTVLIDGEPWFVAADVASVLGYRDASNMARNLDEDEKGTHILSTPGGEQNLTTISEPGLYEAIIRSRIPQAQAFKRWVKHEVLPQIRKTGSYGNADTLAKAPSSELLMLAAEAAKRAEEAEQQLAIAAPKVEAFDDFMESDGTYRFDAAAKSLADVTGGLGRNNLMKWLRAQSVLMSDNTPYQRYSHWFKVIASTYTDRDGHEHATRTTYVRPAGLDGIRQMWRRAA